MCDPGGVLSILCAHLSLLLNIPIKPEHFKSAKFNENKDNNVRELWNVLHSLCLGLELKLPAVGDDIQFVKMSLLVLGYENFEFYSLPSDMSSGSRELLIAFSWLIAKTNVLESIVQQKVLESPLVSEYGNTQHVQLETSVTSNQKADVKNDNDCMHYILLMAGKISHNLKIITETSKEMISLVSKVHQSTATITGLPHLSVVQTRLLKDPEKYASELQEIKRLALVIETWKQWLKRSTLFWEWMAGVLIERKNTSRGCLQLYSKEDFTEFINSVRMMLRSYFLLRGLIEHNDQKNETTTHSAEEQKPELLQDKLRKVETFQLPRLILQSKDDTTVLEKYITETDMLVKEMEVKCNLMREEILSQLKMSMKGAKYICLFNR
ncbi:tubulin epsilon and delta complex protein 1-like isoform X1 [Schistocerca piceifrons]|uniref:tubulin epsilon and delta complex protein 1-like isoform X1 n=2 Tax=Schistocerca piceifrons TaxID=274613 RepID=UPI001F5F961A|nr:tubulin epsilon and delta complex protein 1-like isoform X1 [Schistocerca piceifrons]